MANKKEKSMMVEVRKKRTTYVIILLAVLFVINLMFFLFYLGLVKIPGFGKQDSGFFGENEYASENLLNKSEIFSLEDFVEVSVEMFEDLVILRNKKDKCSGMIVSVDLSQVYSIEQGLNLKVGIRPMSHDVIRDILEQYDIKVVMMKITDLKGGTYFGRLILDNGDKILNLDIRTSDGIAIAVRTEAPIYLSKSLLDEFNKDFC